MAEYLRRDDVLSNADIITVQTREYGTIDVVPVEYLADLPTPDVVEVKHSRWENISGFDVCNVCGTSPAYCEPKPNNPKGYPPYCHHCGAKMDGNK